MDLYTAMLGKFLNRFEGSQISTNWLEKNFNKLPDDATEVMQQYARAFIISECVKLIWGFAMLSTLYQELCRATQLDKMLIGGYLLLLQSWAWWRIPFLRHKVTDLYMFPLVTRWNHGLSYVKLPDELEDVRLLLDQRSEIKYVTIFVCQPRDHILHRARSFEQLGDVGLEGTIDSVRDGGNARIRLGSTIVRVYATNSTSVVRHKGTTEGGHAREEQ
ncbi:hypothetical protein Goari_016760 [Gossypium aridum]|uniref:Aminotransferase-like plant mobile domain-containing protein n=1 Tax=Gossypium aridum TaxID=34290 RepID=A0A7J8WJG4_GOSAI|nr:hypothetical protein [Gossypium aridum]